MLHGYSKHLFWTVTKNSSKTNNIFLYDTRRVPDERNWFSHLSLIVNFLHRRTAEAEPNLINANPWLSQYCVDPSSLVWPTLPQCWFSIDVPQPIATGSGSSDLLDCFHMICEWRQLCVKTGRIHAAIWMLFITTYALKIVGIKPQLSFIQEVTTIPSNELRNVVPIQTYRTIM